jgi:4-nitrophenyl phosphatase
MVFTLLIDMDGVLTKNKEFEPFEDAPAFISFIKERGIPFRVVSNNSTRKASDIAQILREKGLPIGDEEIITPLVVLPSYLSSLGVKRVFVIGTRELTDYLAEEGFEVVYDHSVDAVVIGQDKEIDFFKIKTASSAVFLKGARIVPVNRSRIVKDSDGLYFPGSGSTASYIAYATNYEGDIPNLGKPSEDFIKKALEGLPSEKVFLVSDDIYTDLKGADKLGIKTVFMTTGKYSAQEIHRAGFKPDYVFNSLSELMEEIKRWLYHS